MAKNITGASLGPIYDRLNGAPGYHPLEADTFADWSVESGDLVTVSREGREYRSPVHSSTLTWKKGQQMTLSSMGNEKRQSVAKMSQKKYRNGGSGLQSNNYWHQYVEDQYKQLRSGLELTGSTAHLYVDNKYSQMSAGLKLSESSAHLYVNNKYSQMSSGLKLSESSAHLYVVNKYNQMSSGLKLSESSAHLYVRDSYRQMSAGLKLSESSAHLYVNNKYSQMSAGLKLSESSAHLYVNNKYSQMSAGLKLSESSAHMYVRDMYKQMSTGLQLTSSSAMLYARSRTSKAQIIARINEDGGSEALIEGDRVSISGKTTISDALLVVNGAVGTKQGIPFICQGNLNVDSNDTLNLYNMTFQGSTPISIDTASMASTIKSAELINNNTQLLLTRYDGTSLTFSKAASLLSGTWSGGTLTVTAGSTGETSYIRHLSHTMVTSGSSPVLKIMYYGSGTNPQYYETGHNISMSTYLESRTVTSNGTYTPTGTGKIGISSVEVDVHPTISYLWGVDTNKGKLTVWTSPSASSNFVRQLSAGAKSLDGKTYTVPINALWGSSNQYSESTHWSVTVNADEVYDNGHDAGYDAGHSMYIGDSEYTAVTSLTLSLGESVDLWPYFLKTDGSTYQYGTKATITAPDNPYPTRRVFTCTSCEPIGNGLYNATFTNTSTTQFSTASGSNNYVFHNNSGYT